MEFFEELGEIFKHITTVQYTVFFISLPILGWIGLALSALICVASIPSAIALFMEGPLAAFVLLAAGLFFGWVTYYGIKTGINNHAAIKAAKDVAEYASSVNFCMLI